MALTPHPRISWNNSLGSTLRDRIRKHGLRDVLRVLRWFAQTPHVDPDDWNVPDHIRRPSQLRRMQKNLNTLMSPGKFDEYLEFVDLLEMEEKSRSTKPKSRGPSQADREYLERSRRAKEARRRRAIGVDP